MHTIITPSQIGPRLQAIMMPPAELARRAGIHHTTLARIMDGGNCEYQTLQAITEALMAEEKRLQAHLNSLYPEGQAA